MGDPLAGMIPYDAIGLYEQPKPIFRFKMPRVVPEQKTKFESDELFRRLGRESEVSANAFSVRAITVHTWMCLVNSPTMNYDEQKNHLIQTN